MSKPGVEAVTMFRNVQLKVKQTIGQDPWLSFPTLPAIYFAGKVANDEQLRQQQIETAFWESAKTNGSSTLLSTYIERYPTCAYVTVARTMIQDLERKQAQIDHAGKISRKAKLVKLADKIANVNDIDGAPPAGWSVERKREYFDAT